MCPFFSNNKVGYYDDFEERFVFGKLAYNGHGTCVVFDDGSSIVAAKNKYQYYILTVLNFNFLSLKVDNDIYKFTDKEDMEEFLRFLDLYNDFIERIFAAVIQKCYKEYISNHNLPFIKNLLRI